MAKDIRLSGGNGIGQSPAAGCFDAKAATYLTQTFDSAKGMARAALAEAITHGKARAIQYGIADPPCVLAFIDLQWRLGPDFDSLGSASAWAHPILTDMSLDAETKIALLHSAYLLHDTVSEASHDQVSE